MPIFEFRCRECETTFEELVRSGNDEASRVQCVSCGSNQVEKLLSAFGVGGGSPPCGGGGGAGG